MKDAMDLAHPTAAIVLRYEPGQRTTLVDGAPVSTVPLSPEAAAQDQMLALAAGWRRLEEPGHAALR